MRKILLIVSVALVSMGLVSAQDFKFGHINMQEIVFLMDETDSARVQMENYNKEIQDTYNAMLSEYQEKMATYQQMGGNWSPAVRQAKEREIMDLENRLQQYQTSAQQDMQMMQQQLMGPIQQKAIDAVSKVARGNNLIYVFDLSSGAIPYFDENLSTDITSQVKNELKIPLEKTIRQ